MLRVLKCLAMSIVMIAAGACLPNGNDKAAAGEPATALVVQQESAAPKQPLIQVGPWYPLPFNLEEPYINIVHASSMRWNGGGHTTQQLLDNGYIDKTTGLPVRLPEGKWLESDAYFPAGDAQNMLQWDGDWVLEWEGDADLWILYLPNEYQWRESKNRIEFTRDFKRGKTVNHNLIQIRRLNGPLKNLRLYRKENEEALRAGKIYNPKFAAAVSRYHVVRSMDLQLTNQSAVRSIDDLPGPGAPFWGNMAWMFETAVHQPYRSMPLNAVVALAAESGTALWASVPITLGSPLDFFDDSIRNTEDTTKWAGAYRGMARENAAEIIASPEWDRYADKFVAALAEEGYPADRPVYVTVANEVWNFAWQYFHTTQYAWGLGEGLPITTGEPLRLGYGIVMARWKLALDAALERAGRPQPVVYVVEGQAYYPARTEMALAGAKAYLESQGHAWDTHAPHFGASVASYWSATWYYFVASAPERVAYEAAQNQLWKAISSKDENRIKEAQNFVDAIEDGWEKLWLDQIETDPDGTARRFADFILTDPAQFGLPSVLDVMRQNQKEAAKFGVPMLGAYEGGSHLERPGYIPKDWYKAFLWGEHGGRVNREVNAAIAKAFPGFILSNYGLAGAAGSQPWFEGFIGADNPYARSWEPYLHPVGPGGDSAPAEE